jgi:hypothetical protein
VTLLLAICLDRFGYVWLIWETIYLDMFGLDMLGLDRMDSGFVIMLVNLDSSESYSS